MKNSRSNAYPLLTAVAHREGGSVFAGHDLKRTRVQEPVVTVSTGKRTPSICANTLQSKCLSYYKKIRRVMRFILSLSIVRNDFRKLILICETVDDNDL